MCEPSLAAELEKKNLMRKAAENSNRGQYNIPNQYSSKLSRSSKKKKRKESKSGTLEHSRRTF